MNFLDANVWLALIWSRHTHSEAAGAWFDSAAGEQFLSCRLTQLTVLRLLTTYQIMGNDTLTLSGAWALWDQVRGDDRIAFVDEPAGLEFEFRLRTRLKSRSPKLWADAYLLAFAAVAGLRLVTFDRALKTRSADVLLL